MTAQKQQEQTGTPAKTAPGAELVPVDQVAVIRSKETGQVRMFKSTVVLSVANKGLVSVPGMSKKVGNEWVQVFLVSADGYKAQAQASGIEVCNAPTVIVDGVEQKNPYVERDQKTGRPRMVTCRAVAYGYTRFGKPVRSDRTAVLDLELYRLTDLMAKAKKDDTANYFRILPSDADRPGAQWAKYPIDDAVTLWADTSAPDFTKWMGEAINRAKKAVELCQSFAQRNAIHHHPGITTHTSEGIASVPVTCWFWAPEKGSIRWDGSAYEINVKRLVGTGAVEYTDAREATTIEEVKGTDAVHEESADVRGAVEAEVLDETDLTSGEESDGQQTEQQRKQDKVIEQIKTMASAVPGKKFSDICTGAGVKIEDGEAWELAHMDKLLAIHSMLSAALSTPKKGGK